MEETKGKLGEVGVSARDREEDDLGALGEVGERADETLDAEVTFKMADPVNDDGNRWSPPNPWASASPSPPPHTAAPSIPVPKGDPESFDLDFGDMGSSGWAPKLVGAAGLPPPVLVRAP